MHKHIKQVYKLCVAPFSLVLTILCLTICFQACKKKPTTTEDSSTQNNPTTTPSPTTAPAPTTTLTIDSNNTSIKLWRKNLYGTATGYGATYTLDVNCDSIGDLAFEIYQDYRFAHLVLIQLNNSIKPLNSDTYLQLDSVTQRTYYRCNLPDTTITIKSHFPKPFNYGDKIDINANGWYNIVASFVNWDRDYSAGSPFDTSIKCRPTYSDQFWAKISEPKYIAFKFKGKPGWIKIRLGGNFFVYSIAWAST